MKSYAQTLELVDDSARIAEYVNHHRAVWPEVLVGLRGIGVRTMRIFLHGNRLFMYMETDDAFDPARDYQTYANDPRTRQWDELMRTYQQRVPAADPGDGQWWSEMTEVFSLAEQLARLDA
ncbi:MAG: L-rhamnose mutarotase [Phycisphaerales bacterium]|nr:L-rhamnose mutarotase [Phycisphaerales bacterium]